MRFNHMEMTFPVGTLTKEFREEVDGFYGSVFGWTALDTEVVGQSCHLLYPTRINSSCWPRARSR